jgi:hypothetical protein
LVRELSDMRAALARGDYAAASRALAVVSVSDAEGQETLRQAR